MSGMLGRIGLVIPYITGKRKGHMPIIGGYRKLKILFHIAIFPRLNLSQIL